MSVGLAIFDCENDVGVVLVNVYAVTVSAYWLTTRTLDLVIDYAGPGVSVIVDFTDKTVTQRMDPCQKNRQHFVRRNPIARRQGFRLPLAQRGRTEFELSSPFKLNFFVNSVFQECSLKMKILFKRKEN